MEINTNLELNAQLQHTRPESASVRQDSQMRLYEGQTVAGEIVNITPDSVTLSTEEGLITAGLRELPTDAKIGDTASFVARLSDSGELVLEIKQMASEAAQKAIVYDALVSAGFKASPENIKMAISLLDNGLALTKENLLRFNQALKLLNMEAGSRGENITENGKIDEALFMLKNNMKISPRAADTLEKLLSSDAALLKQLDSLADSISNIKDPALRESLTRIFSDADPVSGMLKGVISETDPLQGASKIIHAFNELSPEDLEKFAKGLLNAADTPEGGILKDPKLAEALLKGLEQGKVGVSAELSQYSGATDAKAIISDILASKGKLLNQIDELFARPESELSWLKLVGDDSSQGAGRLDSILKALKIQENPEALASNELSHIEAKLTELLGEDSSRLSKQYSKMRFDPQNTTPADVDNFLNELNNSISAARNELLKNPSPESANIMKELADISNNLEFSAQLKENLFLQLPVIINNHQTNSELYVFKDSKRKKRSGASTALIALDTAYLDRVEAYIQKEGSSVSLQFRVKTDDIKDIVSFNVEKLTDQLKERGITLQSCQFGLINEKFTVLSDPDGLKREQAAGQGRGERRVVFDVRL